MKVRKNRGFVRREEYRAAYQLMLARGKNQEKEGTKPVKGPRWWWGGGWRWWCKNAVCFPRGMGRPRNPRSRIYESLGFIPRVLMAKIHPEEEGGLWAATEWPQGPEGQECGIGVFRIVESTRWLLFWEVGEG